MSERRLAAVMFVDLVGYTQLSQRNENQALLLLDEYRRQLRPVFGSHGGKEIKTMGDGFLVEFGSALEAVRCSFDIQQSLHDLNSSRPPEKKLLARVGVHVGDVVSSENDIHGDAVNIASRIEPLADPGGISISQAVQTQVRNKFEFPIVSLGQKVLKNVDSPMEVFKVVLPWDKPVQEESTASPKTRIAVLPFTNISPDQNDEYFADGMTEELINTISHNHQLKVIARTTVGRYKGTPKSIFEIGKEIGVGSVLEGSVRKSGNKIRVTAQLVDASTEDHLWSENFDRQLDDVFSIQSEIAKRVSEALMAKLVPEEQAKIERRATKSPTAYVRYLRGRTLMRDRTESGLREALRLFQEAIEEDREYADAYTGVADVYHLLDNYDFMPREQAEKKGREALTKALEFDFGSAEAHNTLAEYLSTEYKFDDAEKEFKKAISINPNYSLAHHWYSITLLEMGKLEDAFEETRLAQELDPLSPALASNMAIAGANLGKFAEAEEQLRKLRELDTANQFTDFAFALVADKKMDWGAAVMHTEDALKRHPNNNGYLAVLGYYYGKGGMVEKAMEILERVNKIPEGTSGKPFYLGTVHRGLGQYDEMFKQFNLAIDERSMPYRALRYTSDNQFKTDPRYGPLFERVGLTPS